MTYSTEQMVNRIAWPSRIPVILYETEKRLEQQILGPDLEQSFSLMFSLFWERAGQAIQSGYEYNDPAMSDIRAYFERTMYSAIEALLLGEIYSFVNECEETLKRLASVNHVELDQFYLNHPLGSPDEFDPPFAEMVEAEKSFVQSTIQMREIHIQMQFAIPLILLFAKERQYSNIESIASHGKRFNPHYRDKDKYDKREQLFRFALSIHDPKEAFNTSLRQANKQKNLIPNDEFEVDFDIISRNFTSFRKAHPELISPQDKRES